MRISDWSSDVCSSDLLVLDFGDLGAHGAAADLDPVGAPRQQPIIVQPQQVGGELVGHLRRIVSRGDHVAAAGVDLIVQRQRDGLSLDCALQLAVGGRSEEHTSELQSLMRISYAVFCLKQKNTIKHTTT